MIHPSFKSLYKVTSLKNAGYSRVKKIEFPEEASKNNDCDQRSKTCSVTHNREALTKMQLGR